MSAVNNTNVLKNYNIDSLNQYQRIASTTAIYNKEVALEYLAAGLSGEVGELTSIIAKQLRKGNYGRFTDVTLYPSKDIKHEIGDVLWFLAQIATAFEFDLSEIASSNINKLKSRAARGVIEGSGDDR
jgi:NTP pyrophosphatase (non-canonical NTP hydrolase)